MDQVADEKGAIKYGVVTITCCEGYALLMRQNL
jgi:hypothetical protein